MRGVIRGSGDKAVYLIDGREVTKAEFDLAFPDKPLGAPGGHSPGAWPLASDALAVHPRQIPEAMERDRKRGIASEYLPDGRMVLRDRGQRRDVLRSLQFHDNQGGYGD
jgi:hypothetical protein